MIGAGAGFAGTDGSGAGFAGPLDRRARNGAVAAAETPRKPADTPRRPAAAISRGPTIRARLRGAKYSLIGTAPASTPRNSSIRSWLRAIERKSISPPGLGRNDASSVVKPYIAWVRASRAA